MLFVRSREREPRARESVYELNLCLHTHGTLCMLWWFEGNYLTPLLCYTVLLILSQFICNHRDTCIDTMELYYTHMHPWDSIFPGEHRAVLVSKMHFSVLLSQ